MGSSSSQSLPTLDWKRNEIRRVRYAHDKREWEWWGWKNKYDQNLKNNSFATNLVNFDYKVFPIYGSYVIILNNSGTFWKFFSSDNLPVIQYPEPFVKYFSSDNFPVIQYPEPFFVDEIKSFKFYETMDSGIAYIGYESKNKIKVAMIRLIISTGISMTLDPIYFLPSEEIKEIKAILSEIMPLPEPLSKKPHIELKFLPVSKSEQERVENAIKTLFSDTCLPDPLLKVINLYINGHCK